MQLRNLWLAFKDQLPLRRFLRNLWKGNLKGWIHIRSHLNADGKPKVAYPTKASAYRAAKAMAKKRHARFGCWKCVHCDGYHIGKNR